MVNKQLHRKFWRHEMPRLKYHNPAVPMTIDRTALASDPAVLSIHFAPRDAPQTSQSATSSPAPTDSTTAGTTPSEHTPSDRVESIDCKERTNGEIMEAVVQLTKAYPVEATAEDREQLRVLEEQRLRSLRDSKQSQEMQARKKREREMLEQARGDQGASAA